MLDLSVPRKVRPGKMKASGKLSTPARGCILSEAFFAHSERRNPWKMPSRIQSHRTNSRLYERLFVHFLCMCSTIFTVTCYLWFGIDSHRLTSERTYLMHWASRQRVFNSGSVFCSLREGMKPP